MTEDYKYILAKKKSKILAIFEVIKIPIGDRNLRDENTKGKCKIIADVNKSWRILNEYEFYNDAFSGEYHEDGISFHKYNKLTKEMLVLLL